MKQVDSKKNKRKKAEESILRNMRNILDKVEVQRAEDNEKKDREKVMSVLTQFMKLKKDIKIH